MIFLSAFLFPSCSEMQGLTSQAEATEEASLDAITPIDSGITTEGRIVPKESVQLAFTASGQITDVFVQEGDEVKKGTLLAQLSGRPQLEAAIAAAELELFSAQQALKSLNDNLNTEQNQALQALNVARQAFHDADRKVKSLGGVADKNDIDIANTQVIFAENALNKARDAFAPYASLPEDNLRRAQLQVQLANKQKEYDAAVRKYNALTGSASNFDLNQASTDLEIAQMQLKLAQEQYELLEKGPDPDALADTEARISTAKSRLAAAKSDLERLDLRATIDGRVVSSDLTPGKTISAGQPLVELADFSEWDVETENLTEIEVVDISIGQKVSVIPDALPDIRLNGEVISISDTFEEKRGDITYTVRIKLNEVDPRLRWGMTVVTNFEK
jgi:multidrug resistance efflux pump